MSDAAKACSRSAKKRTEWRSCNAQKQSDRHHSEPKLDSSGALKGKGVGGGGGGGGGLEPITNYRIKHVDTHFFIVVDKINLINKNQPKNWPTPLHKCCSPINLYCKGQSPKEGGPFPKEKVGRGCWKSCIRCNATPLYRRDIHGSMLPSKKTQETNISECFMRH
jgi:hypothetical protein